MRLKFRKGVLGYLMIPLVLLLEIILYYLEETLQHGQSFLYQNSYGQGLLTWWWNFEWFWGYIEFNTIKACLIAAWLIYYSPPTAQMRTTPKKSPWIWALIILVAVALIFSTSSPNSPIPYNVGTILLWGWDPAFGARHLLEILLFATGFWTIPILIILRRHRTTIRRWNSTTGFLLCIGAALTTHLVLVGNWQVEEMLNLENLVLGAGGFLLLSFPVILSNLALFMKGLDPVLPNPPLQPKAGVNWRDFLLWVLVLGGFLGITLGVLWTSLNKSIEIGSQWVPYNFWSLIYVALFSTTMIQSAWHTSIRSKLVRKDAKLGVVTT